MANENIQAERQSVINRALNTIEKIGNKLPDPAALFLILLFVVWILSWLLSNVSFAEIDPRSGKAIAINNQLTGTAIAAFLSTMVKTFTDFHPLGIVLVALLGVGVAEHTGFINAALKWLLSFTSKHLLTPMLVLIGVISNLAADAGYVLVIPLSAVIFYSAGRHPLAGRFGRFQRKFYSVFARPFDFGNYAVGGADSRSGENRQSFEQLVFYVGFDFGNYRRRLVCDR